MKGWFDSHCHLPGGEAPVLVDEAVAAGVTAMITVGCDRATSEEALAVAARFPGVVHATVGLHPHEARHGVATIGDLFDGPVRPVAVGECGLDYHYDHSPRDAQRAAFAAQVAMANERRLPLVIHTREAWDDTFDILDAEGVPARTIFHCFTGGPDDVRRCLDRGAYVSFSGIVTFNGAPEVREAPRPSCPSSGRSSRPTAPTSRPYRTEEGATDRRGYRSSVPASRPCTASPPTTFATRRTRPHVPPSRSTVDARAGRAVCVPARVFLAFPSSTWTGTGDRSPEQGASREVRRS